MTIITNRSAGTLELIIKGKLDTSTAPALEEKIEKELTDASALILDCSSLEYITSDGLRVLLAMQKQMKKQGKMVLRNVNDMIMEVLTMTGFRNFLTIE